MENPIILGTPNLCGKSVSGLSMDEYLPKKMEIAGIRTVQHKANILLFKNDSYSRRSTETYIKISVELYY